MLEPMLPPGLKVFLVEDESLVAMQPEDMVADLGCDCVGLAMKLSRALDMLDVIAAIDVAILDVNLGGDKVYPVAERLRQRNVPIVFATGYGRAGVDAAWQSCEVVQKPYTMEQIASAVGLAREGATRS
ncbi:response regulator [Aureimonas sp. SA4125]|uniref:response regulator n=1 Tax=Aureimonas sp. SA4125 TaxID=2826993 RepID=UPI001CC7ACE3|nr:response regulator [Aureimonas sp. SA4125]BDA85624.1 response regulator [Aureimonas sp. SA4125]